jgi:hypothetical protein
MCFTEKKRENVSKKTPRDIHENIIKLTKELGAQAIRLVGLGEPLLDQDIKFILDLIQKHDLHAVLFTNSLILDQGHLDDFKNRGNISLLTKLWGNPETMTHMTCNDSYLRNTVSYKTDFGEIDVPSYVDFILRSGFHEITDNNTNFGLEFMVTRMNIEQLPLAFAFMLEQGISPYIRTPFPVNKSEGIALGERGIHLPSRDQFEKVNEQIKRIAHHYGSVGSLRQGSETKHCMRTVYNFVFENQGDKVIARPCHHQEEPMIEITRDLSVNTLRQVFLEAYEPLRKIILGTGESIQSKELNLIELMEGCVCAARYEGE